MYIGFLLLGEYTLATYSFHKFQSAFLFAALSVTISDWAAVLHDIHEYPLHSFLFRRATLITISVVYFMISLVNFVFCFSIPDLDTYINSPIYLCAVFLQISMNFLLTGFMLHAGLKLHGRIYGAVGNLMEYNGNTSQMTSSLMTSATPSSVPSTPPTSTTTRKKHPLLMLPTYAANAAKTASAVIASTALVPDGNIELRQALINLNMVMATCTFCILMQVSVLHLNRDDSYILLLFYYIFLLLLLLLIM
jgi:hypothetical protein